MGEELANVEVQQQGEQLLKELLFSNLEALKKVAPAYLTPDRLFGAMLLCRRSDPRLAECTAASFIEALMDCGRMGLEPGPKQLVYLIPYRLKGVMTLRAQPSYRGLILNARESGEIVKIEARVVFEGDTFELHEGTESKIIHRPNIMIEGKRKPVAAYAIAKFKNGDYQHDAMSFSEIEDIRAVSQANTHAADNPWEKFWPEMAKKTVAKRLCKYLPVGDRLANTIAIDNAAEGGGNTTGGGLVIDMAPMPSQPAPPQSKSQGIMRQLAASAPPPRSPGGGPAAICPWGDFKGQPLTAASDDWLQKYLSAARKAIADPAKEKFRAKDQAWLTAVEAEIARRAAPATPPPPQQATPPAGRGVPEPPPPGDDDWVTMGREAFNKETGEVRGSGEPF